MAPPRTALVRHRRRFPCRSWRTWQQHRRFWSPRPVLYRQNRDHEPIWKIPRAGPSPAPQGIAPRFPLPHGAWHFAPSSAWPPATCPAALQESVPQPPRACVDPPAPGQWRGGALRAAAGWTLLPPPLSHSGHLAAGGPPGEGGGGESGSRVGAEGGDASRAFEGLKLRDSVGAVAHERGSAAPHVHEVVETPAPPPGGADSGMTDASEMGEGDERGEGGGEGGASAGAGGEQGEEAHAVRLFSSSLLSSQVLDGP